VTVELLPARSVAQARAALGVPELPSMVQLSALLDAALMLLGRPIERCGPHRHIALSSFDARLTATEHAEISLLVVDASGRRVRWWIVPPRFPTIERLLLDLTRVIDHLDGCHRAQVLRSPAGSPARRLDALLRRAAITGKLDDQQALDLAYMCWASAGGSKRQVFGHSWQRSRAQEFVDEQVIRAERVDQLESIESVSSPAVRGGGAMCRRLRRRVGSWCPSARGLRPSRQDDA